MRDNVKCPECEYEFPWYTGSAIAIERHGQCLNCFGEDGICEEDAKAMYDVQVFRRYEMLKEEALAGRKIYVQVPVGLQPMQDLSLCDPVIRNRGANVFGTVVLSDGIEALVIIPEQAFKKYPFNFCSGDEADAYMDQLRASEQQDAEEIVNLEEKAKEHEDTEVGD